MRRERPTKIGERKTHRLDCCPDCSGKLQRRERTRTRLTKRLRKHAEYIFTFVDYDHVSFDDNFADRQIHTPAILRKNPDASGSNPSDQGAAMQAVLMSVYRTLASTVAPTKPIADALKTYLTTAQLLPLPV